MRRLVLALALAALAATASADGLLEELTASDAALEARLHAVLVAALAGHAQALDDAVGRLAADDAARRREGLPATGLVDDARYLAAALAGSRDAERRALRAVLDEDPDAVVRRLAEHRLESDDAAAATQLLADDRHNRRAGLLNDAVRPLGIFSGAALLAALNPFLLAGSAVDSVVTTAVNVWHYNRLTTPEREALARYRALLEREPRTSEAPEIVRAIRRLGRKRAEALCTETVALGRKTLDDHDLDRARFYLASASAMDGCAERAAGALDDLDDARAAHAAREEAGRWLVVDPPRPASPDEARDHDALARATALGDPSAMIEAASRFRSRHEDSDLAPSATFVLAVARDLAGHHDAAREALAETADEGDASVARHAAALLASPDFSRLDAIRAAERRHARDTARYVLLGGGMEGRTALYSAAQLGAQGLRAAESIGIFNVIGILTRAWQVWRRNPVSNQDIIDRGETFLARQPEAPEASDVHARLADAYERAGQYGRALMHHRATRAPSAERTAALEGRIADELLADAERVGGNPVLLEGLVRHFPDTDAAATAREKLGARHDGAGTVLARDVLEDDPALLGPDALDLDPRLLDGERRNGELAEDGVTLEGGALRLTLRNEDGSGQRTETRVLSPEAYARARAAAQETLYARLLTTERRDPDTGRLERYVPFFVQGTVDPGGGVYVYPGVKMRRYRSDDRHLYE
jgi:hypothetical protein